MSLISWIIQIYISKPIFRYLYGLNFKSEEEYYTNMKRVFTPNFLQRSSDNDVRDYTGEAMTIVFLALCGGVLYLERVIIVHYFFALFY